MCQIWNVKWSSSETLAKEALVSAMAAGEHRYEDSYFMKHARDNNRNEKYLEESRAKKLKTNGSIASVTATSLSSGKATKDTIDSKLQ